MMSSRACWKVVTVCCAIWSTSRVAVQSASTRTSGAFCSRFCRAANSGRLSASTNTLVAPALRPARRASGKSRPAICCTACKPGALPKLLRVRAALQRGVQRWRTSAASAWALRPRAGSPLRGFVQPEPKECVGVFVAQDVLEMLVHMECERSTCAGAPARPGKEVRWSRCRPPARGCIADGVTRSIDRVNLRVRRAGRVFVDRKI